MRIIHNPYRKLSYDSADTGQVHFNFIFILQFKGQMRIYFKKYIRKYLKLA